MSQPDFDALWDYDHPAETETRFRELLPSAASGDSYHLELLTQIARAQGLQRQFEAAHRTLDDMLALLTADQPVAHIRYWLERGRIFNSSKQGEQAWPCFVQAWELARLAGEDGYAVDAAHMLGIAEATPEKQMEWNLRALALAESSPQPRAQKWLGSLYNNIGWTYHDAGQYAPALEIFQKALRWRETHGPAPQMRIARWCVARALRSLGQVAEALAQQFTLQHELEAEGGQDGYVSEEIGECLLLLNRAAEARPYFARAYAVLSQDPWLAENEPERLRRLKKLGT